MRPNYTLDRWERRHPTAHRIASELLANRPMLTLPRWMVMADIRQRFRVGDCTARIAFALARKGL